MHHPRPTKAIIAAAGFGTRFLPQTKAMPKEMLPIVDKPVIQIIVEQLVAAGVTDIIIVTGYTKRSIEDHFDRNEELENDLRAKGKDQFAEILQDIATMANFVYLRQKASPHGNKGNSLPLLNARHLLKDNEPFFYLFADDFFRCETPYPLQLLEAYEKTGRPVISAVKVEPADSKRLGMIDIENQLDDHTFKVRGLVEKPGPDNTPSNFASAGSFLLTPDILKVVEKEQVGVGGEIVLADAINEYAKTNDVFCRFIEGRWHDAGDKARYLEAIVDHALIDSELGAGFRAYLHKRLAEDD
ncbi:MAG TPA: UTP--glucose-1-phosphate uridylyltransferase [Candidatus Saccharimonadales bacterium]|nr:UTP--glucose-1-phosphate uridylyltransferase [Candidatus Saccharimonadales bacterium]